MKQKVRKSLKDGRVREEERVRNGNNQANKETETADERQGECRTSETTQQAKRAVTQEPVLIGKMGIVL